MKPLIILALSTQFEDPNYYPGSCYVYLTTEVIQRINCLTNRINEIKEREFLFCSDKDRFEESINTMNRELFRELKIITYEEAKSSFKDNDMTSRPEADILIQLFMANYSS